VARPNDRKGVHMTLVLGNRACWLREKPLQRHFARTSPALCHLATYGIFQGGPTRLTAGKDTDTPGL